LKERTIHSAKLAARAGSDCWTLPGAMTAAPMKRRRSPSRAPTSPTPAVCDLFAPQSPRLHCATS
jgi:hypothetical protein